MILTLILKKFKASFADLLPIVLVIVFSQGVVLRQPLPQLGQVLYGALLVVAGLTIFIQSGPRGSGQGNYLKYKII